MIAILVAAAIFVCSVVATFAWCKTKGHPCKSPVIKAAIIAFCFSVAAFLCVELIMIGFASFVTKEERTEIVATQEIIALQDTSSASGQFFLGCGSVGNTEYYSYFTKTEHGYKKGKVNANSQSTPVYIKYTAGDSKPHIDQYAIVTYEILVKKPTIWTSILAYFQYKDVEAGTVLGAARQSPALLGSLDDPNYRDNFRIEIHIPAGSIKEDYEIDLE